MWLRNWVTLCSGRWAQPQEIHHDWALLIMETLFSFAGDWFRGDHRSNFDQSDTRETAAGWVGRLLGKVFLPDKKWGAWEKSIFLLAFEFGLLWRYLKPQQSSCLTNGQDSQLLAAQRTQTCSLFQASLWHPEISIGSISLSSWTLQLCDHKHQMSSMQLKLETGSKLARLGNIAGKVWWGDNMWKDREHTQSQNNAMSFFPRKLPNEEKKKYSPYCQEMMHISTN